MNVSATITESAQLTDEQRAAAREELIKFFRLVEDKDPEQFKMFSGAIDAVWHDLLSDPAQYLAFLKEGEVDERYGHMPATGFGVIQWVNAYHERFGKLAPIWFTAADGNLDQGSYDTYLSTQVVVTAWDCGVIVSKMG